MDFSFEGRTEGVAAVLAIFGELDLASAPALEEELTRLIESECELVLVDLTKLAFIDSTGLHVLISARRKAADAGKRFGIVRGGPQIRRLFSITGVDEHLTVADTLEELLNRD